MPFEIRVFRMHPSNITLLKLTMKKLLPIAVLALLVACNAPEKQSETIETTIAPAVERAVGFSTYLPDTKWYLGTEEAIQVVKDLDKVWGAKDFDAMRPFFADTAKCYFPDGTVTTSPEEFIEIIKAENEGAEISWTFDYAYSVDLDPTRGGEHVQAGFTGSDMKDGVETKKHYHESYYIIDGKIVMWTQLTREIKE